MSGVEALEGTRVGGRGEENRNLSSLTFFVSAPCIFTRHSSLDWRRIALKVLLTLNDVEPAVRLNAALEARQKQRELEYKEILNFAYVMVLAGRAELGEVLLNLLVDGGWMAY